MKKYRSQILILSLLLSVVITSCSSNPSNPEEELVGQWEYKSSKNGNEFFAFDLEFTDNGKIHILDNEELSDVEVSYKLVSSGKLNISFEYLSNTLNFNISNNSLKIYFDNGYNEYIRIGQSLATVIQEATSELSQLTSNTFTEEKKVEEPFDKSSNNIKVIKPENANQITQILRLGNGKIFDIAWSIDGHRVAFASTIGIFIYDHSNPNHLEYSDIEVDFIFSCYDSWLYATDCEEDNSTTCFYDLDSGEMKIRIPFNIHRGESDLAISPDGKFIGSIQRTGNDSTLTLWDVDANEPTYFLKEDNFGNATIEFSPDGKMLAIGTYNLLSVKEAMTGYELFRNQDQGWIYDLAFSPDSSLLLEASTKSRLWNVENWNVVYEFWAKNKVDFSPDGQTICIGSGNIATFFDTRSAESIKSLIGSEFPIPPVYMSDEPDGPIEFSPDGSYIASGGNDGSMFIWNIETEQELLNNPGGHVGEITDLGFLQTGHILASSGKDKIVYLWDIITGRKLLILDLRGGVYGKIINTIEISPAKPFLATACSSNEESVSLWDLESKLNFYENLKIIKYPKKLALTSRVGSMAFSFDGKLLATGEGNSNNNSIFIWNTLTGELLNRIENNSEQAAMMTFSSDGDKLGVLTIDFVVYLFDVNTGTIIRQLQQTEMSSKLLTTVDNRIILISLFEDSISVLDIISGSELSSIPIDQNFDSIAWSFIYALSPDGQILATSPDMESIQLLDLHSGKLLNSLEGHKGFITSVVFSNDGKFIASSSSDGTIRLWGIQE